MSYSWNLCVRIDEDVDFRNAVTLPETILEFCVQRNKQFPYFFSMESSDNTSRTFVSVKQFDSHTSSEIGLSPEFAALHQIYPNQIVTISMVWNVPAADFISIEPLSESFFSIPEYETFLEKELSKYAVMYKTQNIVLSHGGELYTIHVRDIKADSSTLPSSYVETCFHIIDQDIQTDVYNSFQVKRYFEKKREETEQKEMEKEDINRCIKGQRLGGSSVRLSPEEIRKRRLSVYTKKR